MEEWRVIQASPRYLISSKGRVKNSKTGRILKHNVHYKSGYVYIKLLKKHYSIHRLVALAFINNPMNKEDVNHIDENKQNNNVENLEWTTTKENVNHGTRNERQSETLSIPIYAIDNEGTKTWYKSTKDFAEKHKCFSTNVTQALLTLTKKGNKKTVRGYTFEYVKGGDELCHVLEY